mmetsp:Transcript_102790/g.297168  ORF Transcript_102790/g.297168 Transcript_102790/m.297168 type:complete len:267 (+) Transcript_102790:1225-2025(+)
MVFGSTPAERIFPCHASAAAMSPRLAQAWMMGLKLAASGRRPADLMSSKRRSAFSWSSVRTAAAIAAFHFASAYGLPPPLEDSPELLRSSKATGECIDALESSLSPGGVSARALQPDARLAPASLPPQEPRCAAFNLDRFARLPRWMRTHAAGTIMQTSTVQISPARASKQPPRSVATPFRAPPRGVLPLTWICRLSCNQKSMPNTRIDSPATNATGLTFVRLLTGASSDMSCFFKLQLLLLSPLLLLISTATAMGPNRYRLGFGK